jgi:hypothetical protein
MHSRIIELGNAPILPDDRMGECSVPEWFYHSIADYTNAETDRDEDLKWFLEIVAHIVDVAEDGESFTFKQNAKKKYFHRQYYAFLDKARELTGISIEAFCAETPYDIGMAMYTLALVLCCRITPTVLATRPFVSQRISPLDFSPSFSAECRTIWIASTSRRIRSSVSRTNMG